MKNLEELKGEYFAIELKNNETAEIEKQLKEAGYFPDEEWNNIEVDGRKVTYVIVYKDLEYGFYSHSGGISKIITL